MERALIRGGLGDPSDISSLDYTVFGLSPDVFRGIDTAYETPESLNQAAKAIAGLDSGDTDKLLAVIKYAEPRSASALRALAENLDLFDFYPGVHSAEEYGQHMIAESGHFEYDAELNEFYDFDKYGKWRLENECGTFLDSGYLSYRGFVSLEEVMAGVSCERMDMEEAPDQGMTMGGM